VWAFKALLFTGISCNYSIYGSTGRLTKDWEGWLVEESCQNLSECYQTMSLGFLCLGDKQILQLQDSQTMETTFAPRILSGSKAVEHASACDPHQFDPRLLEKDLALGWRYLQKQTSRIRFESQKTHDAFFKLIKEQ